METEIKSVMEIREINGRPCLYYHYVNDPSKDKPVKKSMKLKNFLNDPRYAHRLAELSEKYTMKQIEEAFKYHDK